ncbi:MAG: M23 family metallopeptidase [Bacteroidetes bacterium]|nr:M23 family metallopeptidase [Bacteroidota bacterium]
MSTIFFNHLYASDFLVDTAKNMIDSNGIKLSDMHQNQAFFDLAAILPFHDQYLIWDTVNVHPYNYDLTKMTDTAVLVLRDAGECAFVAPIAGVMTSGYGYRKGARYRYVARKGRSGRKYYRPYFAGYASQHHYGVDLALHYGDSVCAAFDGVVRISQFNPGGYGNCVVIRHYNGLETLYGHLSSRNVVSGQVIKAGELIGLGGSTGHSTGPHLHFETRYKGLAIDPTKIIDFKLKNNDGSYSYYLKMDTLEISAKNIGYLQNSPTYARRNYKYNTPTYAYASGGYVTVRNGDNLSVIAHRYGSTITRICQLNGVTRDSMIRPGQKLRVK